MACTLQAQMVFLTEDDTKDTRNAYGYGHSVDGFVQQNGKYYFFTPRSNFFESGGTKETTKKITQLGFGAEPWRITATKKCIYYTVYNGQTAILHRMNIATKKHEQVTNNGRPLHFTSTFDVLFVTDEQDGVIIRLSMLNPSNTIIYAVKDDGPPTVTTITGEIWSKNQRTLSSFSDVGILKGEVFVNAVDSAWHTTILSWQPGPKGYSYKAYYGLSSRGIFMQPGFISLASGLYVIGISDENKSAKTCMVSLYQLHSNVTLKQVTGFKIPLDKTAANTVAKAEVVNGALYIKCGAQLWQYNEADTIFKKIYTRADTYWDFIAATYRSLAVCNNYLVCSDTTSTGILVRNLATGTQVALRTPDKAYEYNNALKGKTKVYVTNKYIYFISNTTGNEVFTRYNPVTNVYTDIAFPEIKKQQFTKIRCISFNGDRFIFYTEYRGKKADFYNIFMYTDE